MRFFCATPSCCGSNRTLDTGVRTNTGSSDMEVQLYDGRLVLSRVDASSSDFSVNMFELNVSRIATELMLIGSRRPVLHG